MRVKASFCFVGGGVGALRGFPDGGSERQIALLTAELARRGRLVRLVVPGYPETSCIAGVQVIPGWPQRSPWPRGIRLWADRLPALSRTLSGLEPDVLYTRGFSVFAPSVAAVARRTGCAYLAALASDDDLRVFPRSRSRGLVQTAGYGPAARAVFMGRALRRAALVLTQHAGQLEECSRMGLPSRIVRNAFVPPAAAPVEDDRFDAAWIGHLSVFKGFDKLVEVLERTGGRRIAIAGAVQGEGCATLLSRAVAIPGVEYLGELTHDDAVALIASSRVLLNTSPAEGFSNAFLEAWFLGRPVVSLHSDPDGLLSGGEPLGHCASGDVAVLVDGLERLLTDGDLRHAMGARGRERVERHHLLGPVVDSLEQAADAAGH